ncbi:hypothetical protein VNO78_31819 [Psophocarpus tetragonolobus]|uniref:Uncharacterized protein n=1 Tax=Psophocarpus tetragonolobus TaxID=3891 RepID=A0AAN9RYX9_PSOTE
MSNSFSKLRTVLGDDHEAGRKEKQTNNPNGSIKLSPNMNSHSYGDEEEEDHILAQILVSLSRDTWPCESPQVEPCTTNTKGASNAIAIKHIPSTDATMVLKEDNYKKRKLILKFKNPHSEFNTSHV